MSEDTLQLKYLGSTRNITEDRWNRFSGHDDPFLTHAFFHALETSGCTTQDTGWEPAHFSVRAGQREIGLLPAFRKYHSMGEYVFDWGWADAWARHGLDYYPKLLMAVPFTPSMGSRVLVPAGERARITPDALQGAITDAARDLGCHSWHLLFPDEADQELLGPETGVQRLGCQFHWFNRGYRRFDDFLATLVSRKRKSIRKERRRVADQGIHFRQFSGTDITDRVLAAFHVFYQATYLKRGQRPYLNLDFFRRLHQSQPETMHLIMAVKGDEMVAGALFLSGRTTLYGRYWGCLEEYDQLHFETCYYQGIELAIQLGLQRFDAGAQGEHKLVRGFEPVITRSWHWVAHPGFREAVKQFVDEEARDVRNYYRAALDALPYRSTDGDGVPGLDKET